MYIFFGPLPTGTGATVGGLIPLTWATSIQLRGLVLMKVLPFLPLSINPDRKGVYAVLISTSTALKVTGFVYINPALRFIISK